MWDVEEVRSFAAAFFDDAEDPKDFVSDACGVELSGSSDAGQPARPLRLGPSESWKNTLPLGLGAFVSGVAVGVRRSGAEESAEGCLGFLFFCSFFFFAFGPCGPPDNDAGDSRGSPEAARPGSGPGSGPGSCWVSGAVFFWGERGVRLCVFG